MWEFPMHLSRWAAAEEASFHPFLGLLTLNKYFEHHFQMHSSSLSTSCAALPTKGTARRLKTSLAMYIFFKSHWLLEALKDFILDKHNNVNTLARLLNCVNYYQVWLFP